MPGPLSPAIPLIAQMCEPAVLNEGRFVRCLILCVRAVRTGMLLWWSIAFDRLQPQVPVNSKPDGDEGYKKNNKPSIHTMHVR